MPKWLPHRCKVCGRDRADGWHISRRGYCDECGTARMAAAFKAAGPWDGSVIARAVAESDAAQRAKITGRVGGIPAPKVKRGKAIAPSDAVDGDR